MELLYRKQKRVVNTVLIAVVLFLLVGCGEGALTEWGKLDLFEKFLVFPVGFLLKTFSVFLGGYYALGILITTIIVRTAGWPIYTKTNDMSLKMQLMGPEQAKVQEKYRDRQDPDSQKMMQFEMMGLYKKYGVGVGGCLLPFLQFPIFMSIFYAIEMMPQTPEWKAMLNDSIFGVHLFDKAQWGAPGFFTPQNIGVIILAILVTITQVISQVMMLRRQKRTQDRSQADIPEYRRQAQTQQQSQMQKTTQMMMYVMTIMMAVFVIQSPAALGLYWLIGNIYSTAQTVVNDKFSEKRMLKLKKQHNL